VAEQSTTAGSVFAAVADRAAVEVGLDGVTADSDPEPSTPDTDEAIQPTAADEATADIGVFGALDDAPTDAAPSTGEPSEDEPTVDGPSEDSPDDRRIRGPRTGRRHRIRSRLLAE